MAATVTYPEVQLEALVDACTQHNIRAELFKQGDTVVVRGAFIDSRAVMPQSLFICKGATFKPQYLTQALERGASAYLCPKSLHRILVEVAPDVSHIVVDDADLRNAMAYVSTTAWNNPSKQLRITGITGTKGKSSTSRMLDEIHKAAQQPAAIISSIDTFDGVERFESTLTTPESPDLWRHLYHAHATNNTLVTMEVSSQALAHERVLDVLFEQACFLNIGRDHISDVEHANFEDYFQAKLRIFAQANKAIINLDSDKAPEIIAAAQYAQCRLVTFTIDAHKTNEADYYIQGLTETDGVLHFDIISAQEGDEAHAITLPMPGTFNASNALAAAVCAREEDISWEAIAKGLSAAQVPGRMQRFVSDDSKMIVLVDNAHNEMSFHAFFQAVQQAYPTRKILASFGAAGDKSHERREVLPRVASEYAQQLIFTEDDAGHMPFEKLCAEMGAHAHGVPWEAVFERKDAAKRAAELIAGEEDAWIICLLAKGTDTAQHRGDDTVFVQHDVDSAIEIIEAYNARTREQA